MENALLGEREDIVDFLIREKYGLNLFHFVTPQRLEDLYLSVSILSEKYTKLKDGIIDHYI